MTAQTNGKKYQSTRENWYLDQTKIYEASSKTIADLKAYFNIKPSAVETKKCDGKEVTVLYPNGEWKERYTLDNKKLKQGSALEFPVSRNGHVRKEMTYKDGMLDGFYQEDILDPAKNLRGSPKKSTRGQFEKNQKHGRWKIFEANLNPTQEIFYAYDHSGKHLSLSYIGQHVNYQESFIKESDTPDTKPVKLANVKDMQEVIAFAQQFHMDEQKEKEFELTQRRTEIVKDFERSKADALKEYNTKLERTESSYKQSMKYADQDKFAAQDKSNQSLKKIMTALVP